MLQMKNISETYDMKVFTDQGAYFGDVDEAMVTATKVTGWRIKATRGSYLTRVIQNAKGVIVPHQLVQSIGDIMIINKAAVPSTREDDGQEQVDMTEHPSED